jgi:peptidoglycan-associated lipoprotein
MKSLISALVLAGLLAGCADTATVASIEDRAVPSKDAAKPSAAASATTATTGSGSAATTAADAAKPAGKPTSIVETRPMVEPDTKVASLGASQGVAIGPDGKPLAAAGQAGTAGPGAAPVLDPKNPASPLAQRVLRFEYDSAAIRDEYRALLEAHAQYLKQEKAAKTILQGHADERGSREYNLALGQRRAESVYKALSLLGVADAQMEAVSFGEEKPVAEGHDEEAWQQNRRVEIVYEGE